MTISSARNDARVAQALCVVDLGTEACGFGAINSYWSQLPVIFEQFHGALEFDWRGGQYNLFCSENQCQLSKDVPPPVKSIGEEIAEILAGILTLGMAGCSSVRESAPDVIATYKDDAGSAELKQDGTDTSLSTPETQVSPDIPPPQPNCTDSDGDDPKTAGKVSFKLEDGTTKETKDKCKDGTFLEEMICKNDRSAFNAKNCSKVLPDGLCQEFDQGAFCKSADDDGDGIINSKDNCPKVSNTDQIDTDKDGVGDVCDNCSKIANPNQDDLNKNGKGDKCEPVRVFAGYNSTAVIMADGSAWMWGSDLEWKNVPQKIKETPIPSTGSPWISFAMSSTRACAVNNNGALYCWGQADCEIPGNAVPAPGANISGKYYDVVAGEYFFCAQYNKIKCWGSNQYGELGNGTWVNNSKCNSEVKTPGNVPTLNGVQQISASMYQGCALINGTVLCWGLPCYLPDTSAAEAIQTKPTPIKGLPYAIAMGNGMFYGCAITADKAVWCWGDASGGQLGSSPGIDYSNYFCHSPAPVVGVSKAIKLAVGGGVCALIGGGKVLCWGLVVASDGAFVKTETPVELPGVVDVIDISAGSGHTCAVTKSFKVICWGRNDYGQVSWPPSSVSGAPANMKGPTAHEF